MNSAVIQVNTNELFRRAGKPIVSLMETANPELVGMDTNQIQLVDASTFQMLPYEIQWEDDPNNLVVWYLAADIAPLGDYLYSGTLEGCVNRIVEHLEEERTTT